MPVDAGSWQVRHCCVSTAEAGGGPLASSAARARPAMEKARSSAPVRHALAAVVLMRVSRSKAPRADGGRHARHGGGAVQGLPDAFDDLSLEAVMAAQGQTAGQPALAGPSRHRVG